jgi:predicted Holliday junction resolvase-like endonuclease
MEIGEIIQGLKNSNLIAESPCGCEFELSEAILFDGTKSFPEEALETKQSYLEGLKERGEELIKQKKLATEKALITTRSVNIGKSLEKILPTLKAFPWDLADSRFIGDPIDMITFNGFALNKIDSLSFIEVKTGAARLNSHQKMIKEAIEQKRVSYMEFK